MRAYIRSVFGWLIVRHEPLEQRTTRRARIAVMNLLLKAFDHGGTSAVVKTADDQLADQGNSKFERILLLDAKQQIHKDGVDSVAEELRLRLATVGGAHKSDWSKVDNYRPTRSGVNGSRLFRDSSRRATRFISWRRFLLECVLFSFEFRDHPSRSGLRH
jgi:hypothetical protein